MKEKPLKNKIIIIGTDHHNTLAAIRAFGEKHCEIVIVIHGSNLNPKKIQVLSSRYAKRKQIYLIKNDKERLLEIIKKYSDPSNKSVLFPCSDFAEMVIDSNYVLLSAGFALPGFLWNPGKVCKMMDKWNQYLFAKNNNIPTLPTFLINVDLAALPDNLLFPCIVKPRISAIGSKSDIKICQDEKSLLAVLSYYKRAGYKDCVIQYYVDKQYEANSLGCIVCNDEKLQSVGVLGVKIREQLESATSFMRIVADVNDAEDTIDKDYNNLYQTNKIVLKSLIESGYSGQFDIDYLIYHGSVYLNEINFRHSGNGYVLLAKGVNTPYIWALSALGVDVNAYLQMKNKRCEYAMAEIYDKMYIKKRTGRKTISLAQWVYDIWRTDAFAVFNRKDMSATMRIYWDCVQSNLKRIANR